jgi:hypothetical protein
MRHLRESITFAVNSKMHDWWQSLPRGEGARMLRAFLATKMHRKPDHDGDPFDPEVHTDDYDSVHGI